MHDLTLSAWVWKRASNERPRWYAVLTRGSKTYVEPAHIDDEPTISGVVPDEISLSTVIG